MRIGNAASQQFQLDVYGEVIQALYEARRLGVPEARFVQSPARRLMDFIESAWQRPDDGIWEVRAGRRHFVHSKLMAWVTFDRAIRMVEEFGLGNGGSNALVPHWRALRPRSLREDIDRHLRRDFPAGSGGPHYGLLQKCAYAAVVFVAFPLIVLTGFTMSPAITAAHPLLLDLWGGYQSARSVHFLLAFVVRGDAIVVQEAEQTKVHHHKSERQRLPLECIDK